MARTAVTVTDFVGNGSVVLGAGANLDATNDHVITDAEPERTVIHISNTSVDTAFTAVVKAGDYPPAIAAGQGDYTISVAFGTTRVLGPFESGRYLQSDGSMEIDVSAATGKIWAFKIPKGY